MSQRPVQRARRGVLLALASSILTGGCGFQLRQAPEFVFRKVFLNAQPNSPLAAELRRSLGADGKVAVITEAARLNEADVVLDFLQEQREKVVVGLNASGQVREFQLRTRLKFRLRTPKGKDLIGDTELLLSRDISFNEAAVLAKEAEEGLLYRDMQSDIVQQLMRRLSAVKGL